MVDGQNILSADEASMSNFIPHNVMCLLTIIPFCYHFSEITLSSWVF